MTNTWKKLARNAVLLVGLGLGAVAVAGCSATIGEPAHDAQPTGIGLPASPATPSTLTTVYPKTPGGMMGSGDNRQWITLDSHNECKVWGQCTTAEMNNIKAICDRARLAYGIPISVTTTDMGISGGIAVGGGSGLASFASGFGGPTAGLNAVFGAVSGGIQYAYNGALQGTQDSLYLDYKCGESIGSSSGFHVLDVRFGRGPSVIHLRHDGSVAPDGDDRTSVSDEGPVIDTSRMPAGEDKDLIDTCQVGVHREDPGAFDTINACVRSHTGGKRWLINPQAAATPAVQPDAPRGHGGRPPGYH